MDYTGTARHACAILCTRELVAVSSESSHKSPSLAIDYVWNLFLVFKMLRVWHIDNVASAYPYPWLGAARSALSRRHAARAGNKGGPTITGVFQQHTTRRRT